MSRTFRTLALSVALLAVTGSAFASGPGGTVPPPQGSVTTTTYIMIAMSLFGF